MVPGPVAALTGRGRGARAPPLRDGVTGMGQAGVLAVAAVLTGLMAGIYAAFSVAVMPGLARVDDAAFTRVMRSVNVRILNGWFLLAFLGAAPAAAAAALLHRGDPPVAVWAGAGCALYAATVAVTFRVNVPLNDALEAAGAAAGPGAAGLTENGPGAAGLAEARERFEARWTPWNAVRAVLATAAFGCLAVALLLHGDAGS